LSLGETKGLTQSPTLNSNEPYFLFPINCCSPLQAD
jgi:hypothetical protein